MIEAVKNYLVGKLTEAGMSGPIYTDASEAGRHKGLPWASVLTPPERDAEDFRRVDKTLAKFFDDQADTWTEVVRVFERDLHLDVVIAAQTLAEAEAVRDQFLALLDEGVWIDPDHPDGLTTNPDEVSGNRNDWARIEVQSAILSDSLAHIKHQTLINVRLVVHGSVVALVDGGAITQADIDSEMAE